MRSNRGTFFSSILIVVLVFWVGQNCTAQALNDPYINNTKRLEQLLDAKDKTPAIQMLDSISSELISASDSVWLTAGFKVASSYRKVHRYKSATAITESIVNAAKNQNDSLNWSRALYYLGLSYKKLGLYNRALDPLYIGLNIAGAQKDMKRKCLILIQIGNVKKAQRFIEESTETLELALDLAYKLNEEGLAASIFNNLGSAHKIAGDHNKAKEHFFQAIEINKRIGDQLNLSYNYNNLANVYEETGNLSKALTYQEKSIELKNKLDDEPTLAMSYSNMALIYLKMGVYEKAQHLADTAFKIASKYNNAIALKWAYQQQMAVAAARQDFETAYKINQHLNAFEDSLAKNDRDALLSELDAQFKRQELIQENNMLKRGIAQNEAVLFEKNAFLLLFGVCIFVLIFVVILLFYSVKSSMSAKTLNTELMAENKTLRTKQEQQKASVADLKTAMESQRINNQLLTSGINYGIKKSAESLIASTVLTDHISEGDKVHLFAASKIIRRINDIQDLQAISEGQLSLNHHAFSFEECLKSLSKEFEVLLNTKAVKLSLDSLNDISEIIADGKRLRQILANLIESAIWVAAVGSVNVKVVQDSSEDSSAFIEIIISASGAKIDSTTVDHVLKNSFDKTLSSPNIIDETLFNLTAANSLLTRMGAAFMIPNEGDGGQLFAIKYPIPNQS